MANKDEYIMCLMANVDGKITGVSEWVVS